MHLDVLAQKMSLRRYIFIREDLQTKESRLKYVSHIGHSKLTLKQFFIRFI